MSDFNPLLVLSICSALVALASLAGGWLPLLIRFTHTRIQTAISFVAGLMLGIALLHFLPDATEQLHSLDRTMGWVLAGFLAMFFLQRFLHYHTHEMPDGELEARHTAHSDADAVYVHEHESHQTTDSEAQSPRQLSWIGAAAGLTLHSFLAGIALSAAVSIGAHGHGKWIGLGTALAVILHKPFDAMAVSTLMTAAGESRAARYWVIGLFSLVTPLGIMSFYVGMHQFAESSPMLLGSALGFSSGTFLCIACSDLLPELQFHTHDRLRLSVALLAGLAVAIAILVAETEGAEHNGGKHHASVGWYCSAIPIECRAASFEPERRSPPRRVGIHFWNHAGCSHQRFDIA